jgi:hypothetical protein
LNGVGWLVFEGADQAVLFDDVGPVGAEEFLSCRRSVDLGVKGVDPEVIVVGAVSCRGLGADVSAGSGAIRAWTVGAVCIASQLLGAWGDPV